MKCLPISIGMKDRVSSAVQAAYPCNASVLFNRVLWDIIYTFFGNAKLQWLCSLSVGCSVSYVLVEYRYIGEFWFFLITKKPKTKLNKKAAEMGKSFHWLLTTIYYIIQIHGDYIFHLAVVTEIMCVNYVFFSWLVILTTCRLFKLAWSNRGPAAVEKGVKENRLTLEAWNCLFYYFFRIYLYIFKVSKSMFELRYYHWMNICCCWKEKNTGVKSEVWIGF